MHNIGSGVLSELMEDPPKQRYFPNLSLVFVMLFVFIIHCARQDVVNFAGVPTPPAERILMWFNVFSLVC